MANKNKVEKFDLTAAFKALNEIEVPVAKKGIAANRINLQERFKAKAGTDLLLEDYYDVNDSEALEGAQADREAEIAKEKLSRIEKIVDLDASSPEELQPSYVGKVIVQCPQCMTLFYKNVEDIEHSEEDPDIVNVSEVCQHCGNNSGYTLIGKVDAVDETDEANMGAATEEPATEEGTEEPAAEENEEEPQEEEPAATGDLEEVPVEPEEEPEPTEESLKRKPKLSTDEASKIINNVTELKINRQQELVENTDESLKKDSNLSSAEISAIVNDPEKLKIERQQKLVEETNDENNSGETDEILTEDTAKWSEKGKNQQLDFIFSTGN